MLAGDDLPATMLVLCRGVFVASGLCVPEGSTDLVALRQC
jgi:hypothetical protein